MIDTDPTTGPARRPVRPGPRAWLMLIGAESRMVVRDTAGLVLPLGLPLLVLVMNGMGSGGRRAPELNGSIPNGSAALDVRVLPLVLVTAVAIVGVVNMPSFLAYYRRTGVLRRLAATPAHPVMVLVAQIATSLLHTAAGTVLCLVVARLWFDAGLPRDAGQALAVAALATAALYATGMLVAAVAPSPNAAVAIGLVIFFVMGAGGGMFGDTDNLPPALADVGELLPFGAAVQALGAAWVGAAPEPAQVAGLAVATVVSGLLAARLFRWE